jgi:hypothetical protein
LDRAPGCIVSRDDHRCHAALDHAEFFSDRTVGEIRLATADAEVRENGFCVKAVFAEAPIDLAELVFHRGGRQG